MWPGGHLAKVAICSTSSEEWQGSTKAWCWKVLERCVVIKSVEQTWCQVTLAVTVRKEDVWGNGKIIPSRATRGVPDVGKGIYHRRRHWIGGAPSYGLKPSGDEIHSLGLRSDNDTSSCMSRDISDVEIAAELGAKTGAVPDRASGLGCGIRMKTPGTVPMTGTPTQVSLSLSLGSI